MWSFEKFKLLAWVFRSSLNPGLKVLCTFKLRYIPNSKWLFQWVNLFPLCFFTNLFNSFFFFSWFLPVINCFWWIGEIKYDMDSWSWDGKFYWQFFGHEINTHAHLQWIKHDERKVYGCLVWGLPKQMLLMKFERNLCHLIASCFGHELWHYHNSFFVCLSFFSSFFHY